MKALVRNDQGIFINTLVIFKTFQMANSGSDKSFL
jgi:hypothetical protein